MSSSHPSAANLELRKSFPHTGEQPMGIARINLQIMALGLIAVGLAGILNHDLMPIWNPVPGVGTAHAILGYIGICTSLISGICLLIPSQRHIAPRLLLLVLVSWMCVLRLPNFFRLTVFAACWSIFPLVMILAATEVLFVRFATAWDRRYLPWISSGSGLGAARVLSGCSLIFFGAAHFIDVQDTLSLVPRWLPFHLFWAYSTGGTFVAAGLALVTGILAKPAALMSALEISAFFFLVWIPIVASGSANTFQWNEAILNLMLLSSAWIVAMSYSATPVDRNFK